MVKTRVVRREKHKTAPQIADFTGLSIRSLIYQDSNPSKTFSSANMPCSRVKPPCKYAIYGSLIGPSQLSSMDDPCTKHPAAIITLSL